MSAVRLPDPFTHYIFVDLDPRCTHALRRRIDAARLGTQAVVLNGDVNELVPQIKENLPRFTKERGLLSFCFVDPFAADLRFATIRALAQYRMDFLLLLMLGRDARTNFKQYYDDESNTRIAELIDSPNWRDEYRRSDGSVGRFLLKKFDKAMIGLGYQPSQDDLIHQVKIARKNVFLYSLVLYSRHKLGHEFWRETLTRTDPQFGFGL
jgi:three-Cys-motif partner protein